MECNWIERESRGGEIEINNVSTDMSFLYQYAYKEYKTVIEKCILYLEDAGIETCIVRIPYFQELEESSEEEKYCFNHGINLNYIESLTSPEDICQLYKIYGTDLVEQYRRGDTNAGRNINNLQGAVTYDLEPQHYRNTIYIIGQCLASQFDMMREDTLVYHIQEYVDAYAANQYKVQGIAVALERYGINEKVIHSIDFRRGDMVIFIGNELDEIEKACFVDIKQVINERKGNRMFSDQCIHVNQLGSRKIADEINNDFISKRIAKPYKDNRILLLGSCLEKSSIKEAEQYCKHYEAYRKNGVCGSIVMNCNPYTLGHDYLINEAREKVDWLYVFVVEEDKSYFSFEERFKLVRENTKQYENVIVLPSGKMILSMRTFASYFRKEIEKEVCIDASKDLKIFCDIIAPFFNITARFVGSEPFDKVTYQYNQAMKERLPMCKIEVIEISRKSYDDEIISASKVRGFLKKKDFQSVKKMVSSITYDYLLKYEKERKE